MGTKLEAEGACVEKEELTTAQLMYLFKRDEADFRWQSMADSQEYLHLIIYIVQRNNQEGG